LPQWHVGPSPDTIESSQRPDPTEQTGPGPVHGIHIPKPEGEPVSTDAIGIGFRGLRTQQIPIEAELLRDRTNQNDHTDCVLQLTDAAGNPAGLNLTLQIGGTSSLILWARQQGARGFNNRGDTDFHCESYAVALMVAIDWPTAVIWVNNTPCPRCMRLTPDRLKEGWAVVFAFRDPLKRPGDNGWYFRGPIIGKPYN
jgi:hypothetical protein